MNEEFDLIVIGGGSAGCAMAGRLRRGWSYRILLLEAGASDRHYRSLIPALTSALVQHPDFDWRYLTEPDPSVGGRAGRWPAGKRLGGGSAINGMMFIRGHRWDYDHWAELGADRLGLCVRCCPISGGWRTMSAARTPGAAPAVRSRSRRCRARYPITDAWIEAAPQPGSNARRTSTASAPKASIMSSFAAQRPALLVRCCLHPRFEASGSTPGRNGSAGSEDSDPGRPRHRCRLAQAAATGSFARAMASCCRPGDEQSAAADALGGRPGRIISAMSGCRSSTICPVSAATCRTIPAPSGQRGHRADAEQRSARPGGGASLINYALSPPRHNGHRHRPCPGVC